MLTCSGSIAYGGQAGRTRIRCQAGGKPCSGTGSESGCQPSGAIERARGGFRPG